MTSRMGVVMKQIFLASAMSLALTSATLAGHGGIGHGGHRGWHDGRHGGWHGGRSGSDLVADPDAFRGGHWYYGTNGAVTADTCWQLVQTPDGPQWTRVCQ
jgi:hypothetical protein